MAQAESFVDSLVAELTRHPVNSNPFFQTFLAQRLTQGQLQSWLIQYHYFCKHFVKLLEGLLYRTPVEELEMRVQLAYQVGPHLSVHAGYTFLYWSQVVRAGDQIDLVVNPALLPPPVPGASPLRPAKV